MAKKPGYPISMKTAGVGFVSETKMNQYTEKRIHRVTCQNICVTCQNCDPEIKSCTDTLSHLHDLILTLLSRRILTLDQQLIATKAFLYIQSHFINNHEHSVDFIIQLSLLDEQNKTFAYSLRSTPASQIKFSSNEEISLFKSCFYYHFSNLLKDKLLCSSFCARPESRPLLQQIVNLCKLQNDLTSIGFKTLVNFLSSLSQCENDTFFSKGLLVSILSLILANWENPIAGVKESNLILFRLFLSVKKNEISNSDLSSIIYNDLSWNMKSKYLMLMEILKLEEDPVQAVEKNYPDLIPKLVEGMKINYLVSACTELYLFIISSPDFDWSNIFFERLIEILSANNGNESQKWNILSHWMIKTLKKFPQSIESILLALHEKEKSQTVPCNALLGIIMCLKILRKQGIKNYKEFDDFKEWETVVQESLQHIDERIRCESFNLVCSCTKTTVEPTKTECTLVLRFIIENVNFDSSYLRQNLVTSFVIFLERLKRSSISQLTKKAKTAPDFEGSNPCWFLKTLIAFLSQNLTAGSNYQRQITSLKLLKIVTEVCFGHDYFKPVVACCTGDSLLKRLFECVLCETDDVNETAAQIIILYVQNGFCVPNNYTISDCLSKINSDPINRFASNEMLLKICLIEEVRNVESPCRTVPLSNVILVPLLKSVQQQLKILFEDNLKVASTGALFSSLKAITRLISSKEISPFLDFNHHFCSELLIAMEQIVQHLLRSLTFEQTDDIDFAPSFAEMGLAIEKQIQSSALHKASKEKEKEDGILLSSAYQSLLCCIWRNLQACCDLSVSLALAYSEDLAEEEVVRCGKLISDVLMQCRHKGAIEAAGVALGRFISFIVKKNNDHYIDWMDELLAKVFKLLTSESSKTISRRSAGLSILIHRLAVNDTRPYHTVVEKIVPVLLDIAEVPFEENDLVLKDLPQAQALHLLCKIVEDASLRLSVAPFLERIVLALCSSIASPVWGIRNAALQLCGAVILKILGRNKTQETECLVNTTHEQLFSHHEYLKDIYLKGLWKAEEEHPDKLIFLLSILSHTSIQTDAVVTKSDRDHRFLIALRASVFGFLSHKNYEIRKLAAVSFVNLFPMSKPGTAMTHVMTIYSELGLELCPAVVKMKKELGDLLVKRTDGLHNENFVHGYLLLIKFTVLKFKKENRSCNAQFSSFGHLYNLIGLSDSDRDVFFETLGLSTRPTAIPLTYPVKTLIYEICYLLNFTCCVNGKTNQFLEAELRAFTKFVHSHDASDAKNFGVSSFAEIMLRCLVARHEPQHMGNIFWFCSMNYSYNLLDVCLKEMKLDESSAAEMLARCFKFLSVGFFAGDAESRVISLTVIEFVISVLEKFKSNLVGKVDAPLDNIENFSSTFIQSDGAFVSKAILVTAAFLSLRSKNPVSDDPVLFRKIFSGLLSRVPKLITSNFEETRLNIAKSLYFLTKLVSPSNEAVCVIWESIVYLIQDEEFSIRREVSEVVSAIENNTYVLNPFVALSKVIQPSFMLKVMEPELVIRSYWTKCTLFKTSIDNLQSGKSDETHQISNPFNYSHYNFFSEETVVLKAMISNFCIFLRDCLDFEFSDKMDSFIVDWPSSQVQSRGALSTESKANLKQVIFQLCESLKVDIESLVAAVSAPNLENSPILNALRLKGNFSSSLLNTLQRRDSVEKDIEALETAVSALLR